MAECEFCTLINELKQVNKQHSNEGLTHEYNATLVSEAFYEGRFTGTTSFKPMPLRYCPCCGTKIKNEEVK